MNLTDLILGADGKFSHTKLWANIGLAAMTVKFVLAPTSVDLLMAYGALTSAHFLLKKWVDTRGTLHG